MITKLLNYQQELEDTFRLDCSSEDLNIFKEAHMTYKKIRKSRKYIDQIKRITEKYIIK